MVAFPYLDEVDYRSLVFSAILVVIGGGFMGLAVSFPMDSSLRIVETVISVIAIVAGILLAISVSNRANKKLEDIREDFEIEQRQFHIRNLENQIRILEIQIKLQELDDN